MVTGAKVASEEYITKGTTVRTDAVGHGWRPWKEGGYVYKTGEAGESASGVWSRIRLRQEGVEVRGLIERCGRSGCVRIVSRGVQIRRLGDWGSVGRVRGVETEEFDTFPPKAT